MKVIGKLLIVGIIVYIIILLLDDRGKLPIQSEQQEYVSAQIDTTISVRQLNTVNPTEQDSLIPPTLTALVARVDSDSLLRYNLHRHEQAVVTIDLEEHKEPVFFTWDDIKAYFQGLMITYEQYKKYKNNDNH